jgi:hypothetical protein
LFICCVNIKQEMNLRKSNEDLREKVMVGKHFTAMGRRCMRHANNPTTGFDYTAYLDLP